MRCMKQWRGDKNPMVKVNDKRAAKQKASAKKCQDVYTMWFTYKKESKKVNALGW